MPVMTTNIQPIITFALPVKQQMLLVASKTKKAKLGRAVRPAGSALRDWTRTQ
jgi:hypothetical protein